MLVHDHRAKTAPRRTRCLPRPHRRRHAPRERSRHWAAIYPPLEHAEWFGWTPTDLIFPFFLFIVGITTHLSFDGAARARRQRSRIDETDPPARRTHSAGRPADDRLPLSPVLPHPTRRLGVRFAHAASRRRALASHRRAATHRALLHLRRAAHPAHHGQATGRDPRHAALRLLVRDDAHSRPRPRDRRAHARRARRLARRMARPHDPHPRSHVGRLAHVGSRRSPEHRSRDRHRDPRRSHRPLDRERPAASPRSSTRCSPPARSA